MRQMKDSGVSWIGDIPADWRTGEIKVYCKYVYAGGTPRSDVLEYWNGTIPWLPSGCCHNCRVDSADKFITEEGLNNSSTKLIPADTALLAMTGATCGNTAYLMIDACVNQSVTAYVAKETTYSLYIWYLLQAAKENLLTFQTGGAQGGVNVEDCKNIIVPIIGFDEQKRRADYLDSKCSQIDSIIEKQEAIIEKLKEYKLSVITEAVTKGLNPNVEMKDSEIDYIGLVPAHWQVMKFGYCVDIKSNLVDPNEYKDYPQISPESIEKGSAKLLHYQTVEESGVISWNHLFYKGQIVYSKIRPLLDKVIIAPFDGLCSADMYPIETDNDIDFIVFLMLSRYFHSQVALVTENRVKMPKINQNELSDIVVAVPPVEEQISISSALNKLCNEIDEAIHNRTDLIERLKTYKKSLIYEVVTGKKEV